MEANERLKVLRQALNLTQIELARRISRTQTTVSEYESGRTFLNDRAIADICREFGVNEEWLRAGKGLMFKAQENINNMLSADIAKLVMSSDDFTKQLVHAYLSLPADTRATVYEFIKKVVAETENEKQ